jgi:hypothetical protein
MLKHRIFQRDTLESTYAIVFILAINPVLESISLQFGMAIPYSVLDLLLFFSLLLFIYLFSRKISFQWHSNKFALLCLCLYMAYQISIFSRALPLKSHENFKYLLTNQYLVWPLVIPIAVFYAKTEDSLVQLIKAVFILSCIFLVLSAIDFPILLKRLTGETFITALTLPIGFIAMNNRYFSPRKRIVIFSALILSLACCILLARRSCVLTYSLFLMISASQLIYRTKASVVIKVIPFAAIAFCLVIANSDFLSDKFLAKFQERLNDDTRSEVFENFFYSMKEDMMVGKGMTGKYYSPNEETLTDDGVKFGETEYRDLIENGYLQLILKGGYVNLALFILTALPAALLGIFNSANNFTRTCGLTILLFMIDMFFYGLPRLNNQYVLVWISVGVCYSKHLRSTQDEAWETKFTQYGLA